MSARGQRVRFWITLVVALGVIGGAAAGIYRLRKVQASVSFPVARARQGDFQVIVRCRGELRARKSVQIYTPMVPNLRIAWMAPSGEDIKEGDPAIRFDSSSSQQQLAQKQAQLRQAQASLDQFAAQSRITVEQDKSDVAEAKFTVEKAQAEVNLQKVKSKIEGEKAQIDLGVSEQKLKATQATVDLHVIANNSRIASLTRVRDQAQADVELTQARIAQMEVKAPGSGFLSFNMNYSGAMMSTDAKPYKVGDNVYSGMNLGEIPDLSTMELEGKIEEIDRGRIATNMEALVRVDSLPEMALAAKVSQISPLAEASFNEYPPTRSFRAVASILHPDSRLRPGMNGGMDIIVSRIPNAISIPAKALFTRAGKPIVYMGSGDKYRAVEVKVEARNPDELAVTGIPAGATVALVDVEKKDKKK